MEKTKLEELIAKRAENKLEAEYREFYIFLEKSPFAKKIKVGEEYIISDYSDSGDIFERNIRSIKNETVAKNIQERREELIEQETKEVLYKLDNISYLFNQQ